MYSGRQNKVFSCTVQSGYAAQLHIHCTLYSWTAEAVDPPELDCCPDGPRGGQLTRSPTTGWPGPLGRVRPSFTWGKNPQAFPSWVALGGPPWPMVSYDLSLRKTGHNWQRIKLVKSHVNNSISCCACMPQFINKSKDDIK